MTNFTKLFYNSAEEHIEAVCDGDYDSAVVVFRPQSKTAQRPKTEAGRRNAAERAMKKFVAAHPSIIEGSDGQVFRVDYAEVVLPVADFITMWLSWYYDDFDGAHYIAPGDALWEQTAGGEPLRCMNGKPYTLEDSIREGCYKPTPAYYGQLTLAQAAS